MGTRRSLATWSCACSHTTLLAPEGHVNAAEFSVTCDRSTAGKVLSLEKSLPEVTGVKKLINQPANVVVEALEGFALAHRDLVQVNLDPAYVVRADAPRHGQVAIVSGGGSGHEPMHSALVGPGMLDAACPGAIFTSPTPDQIFAATRVVSGGAGVLYIVKNYTGDVMNFDMAAELASAEGITVETVLIADDVAVEDSLYTAGRRGVGTTVLAEKICGAAVAEGWSLAGLAALGRRVNAQSRSMGMALTSCVVPQVGRPTFDLPDDEMEIGIGIHGEPGRRRVPLAPARDVVAMLTTAPIFVEAWMPWWRSCPVSPRLTSTRF